MQPSSLALNPAVSSRVLALLVGDISDHNSAAWVKYGHLFAKLAPHCARLEVRDLDLRGVDRYQNALYSLRLSKRRWREAFQKNSWAFERRSLRARQSIRQFGDAHVVLQHGAIFNAASPDGPPVVVYTDFTYRLAQREDSWRNPFASSAASERWNELEHQVYHSAAMVLSRSEHTRRSLLDDYGLRPEQVAVVGGGVNFEQLPQPAPLTPTPRVLFIGKDFERKGGDLLLAAFSRVRAQVPDAELWMVTARDDIAAPGVRRIAPTYDRAAIAALYRSASVFAMPSRCETWGDVFLEAMAYGLPCIGANSDAMPEIVRHGETGLLIPPSNVYALAGALATLLADNNLRSCMGERGRAQVASTFTWSHVAERIAANLGHQRKG